MLQSASAILWLTDQSAVKDFLQNEPPEAKRRCCWWYFAKTFRLTCKHIPGVQNELADFLSRGNAEFEKSCEENLDQAAKSSFSEMDEALDLVIFPADLEAINWQKSDIYA